MLNIMGDVVLKRVLHPVGQGAFFTEQFFDEKDVPVLNVVYDCGEKNSTKHLDLEIENTLNPAGSPMEIDLMFFSHLDEDHINGIEHLVRAGCLTRKSVVILPLHYPLVVKLMLQYFNSRGVNLFTDSVDEALYSLFNSEAKILGIGENNEQIANDPLDLEDGLAGREAYSQISSMQPLKYKSLWNYLPFNTILDNRYQLFKSNLLAAQIDETKLTDITYVKQHLDKLIDIYKNLPKGIGGVTAINVNSLNVLSYASKDVKCDGKWVNYFGTPYWWHYLRKDDLVYGSRYSCLYTGDCVMEGHFANCLDFILKNIVSRIGLLQIPHHGRQSCYNKGIACQKGILAGFTNFNATHKANKFVKQIVHDFSMSSRFFYQITEDFHSRLEVYIGLV